MPEARQSVAVAPATVVIRQPVVGAWVAKGAVVNLRPGDAVWAGEVRRRSADGAWEAGASRQPVDVAWAAEVHRRSADEAWVAEASLQPGDAGVGVAIQLWEAEEAIQRSVA